jgi:hypothetical protein
MTIVLLLPFVAMTQPTPVEEKVGVLITGWGMPSGYSFEYSWNSSQFARCGDLTEYEGQPCKIGHVGDFPYQSHFNMIPFAICFEQPEPARALLWDSVGIYILDGGKYVSPNPDIPDVLPGDIPPGIPITPLVDYYSNTSERFIYAADPRTGEDYLEGWYMIGGYGTGEAFPNGFGDLDEQGPSYYVRYYGFLTSPDDLSKWPYHPASVEAQDDYTKLMLEDSFGDRVDVRFGFYGASEETVLEADVAEDFANEGFTKLLLARETTDYNNYALHFFTGNYVKERLCELDKLDDTEIHLSRQVGRTPEFNTMNIINLQPFIEAYPLGSTIALAYATRGLPWGKDETTGWFGAAHPWSKEVYFENAYLNYLSWKKAVQKAYGDRYDLVFTKGGIDSDIMEDNFFTFGLSEEADLLGHGGAQQVFYGPRDVIEFAVADGIDKVIVAVTHWNYDSLDTVMRMKEINGVPLTPKAYLKKGIFEWTHYEDALGNEVGWDSPDAVVEITQGPSFSHLPEEFATAYYVVLRGTLERFGLFPARDGDDLEEPTVQVTQTVTKLSGGTVEVTSPTSPIDIQGAKIVIPADPYPTRPQDFTPETAEGNHISDPADTNDCLWHDVDINIGLQGTTPTSGYAQFVGPAVYFGPYRTFFNRDVTITIPYDHTQVSGETVRVYIYNHQTQDWDSITPETVDPVEDLVTFKTQVLGLFRAGIGDEDDDGIADAGDNCPNDPNPGQGNADGDADGDACDTDDDDDTIVDASDNCPYDANLDQADGDSDGVGDVCDNCPGASDPNPGQEDADRDGIGNACDTCPYDHDAMADLDGDTVCLSEDNCPDDANAGQENSDTDWLGDACDNCPDHFNTHQEDRYPPMEDFTGNGIGDACDCEGDFDCDGNVDATDVGSFLTDFGRNQFNNPCDTGSPPCNGDINCDGNVDATDVTNFLDDFGRNQFNNACPDCVVGVWCTY